MFFLFIIVVISVVFRITARFTRDLQEQFKCFTATIFFIKSISLFRAFRRIFNAAAVLFARIEVVLTLKVSIVMNLISLIVFKE